MRASAASALRALPTQELAPRDAIALVRLALLEAPEDSAPAVEEDWPGLATMTTAEVETLRALVVKARGAS